MAGRGRAGVGTVRLELAGRRHRANLRQLSRGYHHRHQWAGPPVGAGAGQLQRAAVVEVDPQEWSWEEEGEEQEEKWQV